MPDTRAVMTRAEFEYNVASPGDFVSPGSTFVAHLDALEITLPNADTSVGDARYRFEGFSTPQRVVMMWCRVHGQIYNDGFAGFGENTGSDLLHLAKELIRGLDWADLSTRLDAAIDEYLDNERDHRFPSIAESIAAFRKVRPAFVRFLREMGGPDGLYPSPPKLPMLQRRFPSEGRLWAWFIRAVDTGKFEAPGHPYYDYHFGPQPSTRKQKAFERWFAKDEVQNGAKRVVETYIRAHHDSLCLITDS